VKWKLEIEMKLLGKNGIRIEIEFFFQNGNNTACILYIDLVNFKPSVGLSLVIGKPTYFCFTPS